MKFAKIKHSTLRIILTVFFLLLSLGQIQRFQITSQVAIYLHELLLAGLVLLFAPDILVLQLRLFHSIRRHKMTFIFCLFLALQTVLFQLIHFDLVSFFYVLRLALYAQLFFLIKIALDKGVFSKTHLYTLLIMLSGLIALFGIWQYIFFPDTRWLLAMGWDDHYYRLISTLFDPGFTGVVIAAGLITYLKVFAPKKPLLVNVVLSIGFMLSILLTYSRATYVALASVLLYNLVRSKQKSLFFIIVLFFAAIPLLPRPNGEGVRLERTASITSRLDSNQRALHSLSLSEVIWGKGWYRDITASKNLLPYHAVTPDNSFIFIFTSIGGIGSVLFLGAIFEHRKFLFTEPWFSILLLIVIHSMFNNSLFYIWDLVILLSTLAIQNTKEKKLTV